MLLLLNLCFVPDRSPYCDDVGAYLLNEKMRNSDSSFTYNVSSYHRHSSASFASVLMLGNYEELDQFEPLSFNKKLDGKSEFKNFMQNEAFFLVVKLIAKI